MTRAITRVRNVQAPAFAGLVEELGVGKHETHIRIVEERNLQRQLLRHPQIVAIEEGDEIPVRLLQRPVSRRTQRDGLFAAEIA